MADLEQAKDGEKQFADSLAAILDAHATLVHRIECAFYENIARLPDFPMRTVDVYGVEQTQPGFIIMQDLYGKVGHAPLMVSGLSLAQCLDVSRVKFT